MWIKWITHMLRNSTTVYNKLKYISCKNLRVYLAAKYIIQLSKMIKSLLILFGIIVCDLTISRNPRLDANFELGDMSPVQLQIFNFLREIRDMSLNQQMQMVNQRLEDRQGKSIDQPKQHLLKNILYF